MDAGLKCGARAVGLKIEIACVLPLIMEVFRDHEHPFHITSLTDGSHSAGSYHRLGLAVDLDFQQKKYTKTAGEWICEDLRAALGPDYDVVLEYSEDSAHIHVEFDPEKQPVVLVAD